MSGCQRLAGAGQTLHSVRSDEQLSLLLQTIYERDSKRLEGGALFSLQELLLNLVRLSGQVLGFWRLLGCHTVHEPIAADLRRRANLPDFHPEGSCQQLRSAEILNRTGSGEGLGSNQRKTQSFGSLVKRCATLHALGEILGFSPRQLD